MAMMQVQENNVNVTVNPIETTTHSDSTSTSTSEDDEQQLSLDHAATDNEADEYVSVNTSLILGIGEIISRTVCMVSCIGVLISAAVTLPAIDRVEDFYDKHHLEYVKHGFEYEDADSYRGAAGWLVFVGSSAIPYNILLIIFRALYLKSVLKPYFIFYALISGVSSVLLALSLFAGGIVSAVFASDNGNLWLDLCSDYNVRDKELDFCDDLQRVATSESAAAALSFLATVVLIVIIVLMIYSGKAKAREWKPLNDYSPLPQIAEQSTVASPLVEVNISQTQNVTISAPSPSQPSANTSEDHVIPSAPLYPHADVSSYSPPSAPLYPHADASSYSPPTTPLCPPGNVQSYGSTLPPPYESVVAMPQYAPSDQAAPCKH